MGRQNNALPRPPSTQQPELRPPSPPPAIDPIPPKDLPPRSSVLHLLEKVLDLAKQWMHHHFILSVIFALSGLLIIVLGLAILLFRPNDCMSTETKYTGKVSFCLTRRIEPESPLVDGLHGNTYADLRGGFSLTIENPDDWSIFPATEVPDKSGRIAKGFSIPPGIIAGIPVGFLTDDAVVAFISGIKINQAVVSVWIYRLAGRTGPVEAFVREETNPTGGKMRKTGAAVAAYWTSEMLSGPGRVPRQAEPSATAGIVRVSSMQVSADHKNALLLWNSPYRGSDIDIIGRFVVGSKDTYYIVAVRPKFTDAQGEILNSNVRTMIGSFRAL
jgi:hypothetical protein